MGLESWGEFNRSRTVLLQVLFKYVMCNFSILWKTIHGCSNFDIEFSNVCNFRGVILIDNLLGYDVKGELLIFVAVHWCVDIKV